jgi:ubiquinone/menaquinone biosynthesis C-methylase UbiE
MSSSADPSRSSPAVALTPANSEALRRERLRVQAAYNRRHLWEAESDLYAPWNPATILATAQRKRLAAITLRQHGVFPARGSQCLEAGCGVRGWLGELIDWGMRETDLHGIDLDATRIASGRDALPAADLRVGDVTDLPWADRTFGLVIASTLFTSILDPATRRAAALEISRVLMPGGCLLWYDFAVNNPRNPDVRKVTRRELRNLFPDLTGPVVSCTLAPPLARKIVSRRNWTWALAASLEVMPFLNTHLLAVLVKKSVRDVDA